VQSGNFRVPVRARLAYWAIVVAGVVLMCILFAAGRALLIGMLRHLIK
jgi:hypothetical protein